MLTRGSGRTPLREVQEEDSQDPAASGPVLPYFTTNSSVSSRPDWAEPSWRCVQAGHSQPHPAHPRGAPQGTLSQAPSPRPGRPRGHRSCRCHRRAARQSRRDQRGWQRRAALLAARAHNGAMRGEVAPALSCVTVVLSAGLSRWHREQVRFIYPVRCYCSRKAVFLSAW